MNEKEKRINEVLNSLKANYSAIAPNKRCLYDNLIQNAAFMIVTLQDLQKDINDSGMVDEYKNGNNQYGKKISATLSAYNTTMKQYIAAIKQLDTLVPVEKRDEFEKDFL